MFMAVRWPAREYSRCYQSWAEFGRTTSLPNLGTKIPGPDVDQKPLKSPASPSGGEMHRDFLIPEKAESMESSKSS